MQLNRVAILEAENARLRADNKPVRKVKLTKYIRDDVGFFRVLSVGIVTGGLMTCLVYEFFLL